MTDYSACFPQEIILKKIMLKLWNYLLGLYMYFILGAIFGKFCEKSEIADYFALEFS